MTVQSLRPHYQGRWWDAPMTDDAVLDPEFFVGKDCEVCDESVTPQDDALATPGMVAHLECHIRSVMGDVQHLEKRCLCFRGAGNEVTYDSDHCETYRESSRAALVWLVEHRQGRFHP